MLKTVLNPLGVDVFRDGGRLHVHPHPAGADHRLCAQLGRVLAGETGGDQQQGLVCARAIYWNSALTLIITI